MNKDTKSAPMRRIRLRYGFTLAEMLIVLLVCSIILIAMAPMLTQRKEGTGKSPFAVKSVEITYGSKYCNNIDNADNSCKGEFEFPAGAGDTFNVTVVGGGGGGGGGVSSGSVEYTQAGTYEFVVPEGVNEIEATLVGGGAGGGAGNVSADLKAISWTHSGLINRSYVSYAYVPDNVEQRTISTQDVLQDGSATLSPADTKYFFSDVVMVAMSAGGGGGGRGYEGAGGGGGAARYETATILKNKNYKIYVGRGGQGHGCCGLLGENAATSGGGVATENGYGYAGCGGGATYIADENNNIILGCGGGGGGAWGVLICDGRNGDSAGYSNSGAKGGRANGGGYCVYKNDSIFVTGGGSGALPNGTDGKNGVCSSSVNTHDVPGAQGGSSLFGVGGEFEEVFDSPLRHGQGYGAGGCGGGWRCKILPASRDCPGFWFTGNGAPGFVGISYHETKNGGGGGGSGSIVPKQRFKVTPGEKITVIVGEGGEGGRAASLSSSFAFSAPHNGENGKPSVLKRGNAVIVMTGNMNDCAYGSCSGKYTGARGNSGYVFRGGKSEGNFDTSSLGYQQNVFYTGSSQYAGGSVNKPSSYEKTMRGGDGGKTIIDKNQFCEPGKGASMTASSSLDATGYGGCGGGGGYGDVDGGNGAPGYVKITWNPDKKGRGGGGSAGYSLKKTIHITNGNDKVSVQIGDGGKGGTLPWGDNAEVAAQNGGDTIFGYAPGQFNLRVGGGLGGENARLENDLIVNGKGGITPTLCAMGNLTGLVCFNGDAGSDATDITSGAGASTVYGSGGFPVQTGNGNSSVSYGAGGSGAGVSEASNVNSPPSTGGSGGAGKIIIEW